MVVAAAGALVLALLLLVRPPANQLSNKPPPQPIKPTLTAAPVDPRTRGAAAALANPGQFAVDLFVYANWPAVSGQRGVPDGNNSIGAKAPTVWESWKNTSEIFRAGGAAPCPWETVCELPDGVTPPTAQELQQMFGPTDSTWLHFLGENRMIDGQQIVDARSRIIRYDVRCNQDHFNYIASNPSGYELFNLDGQELALADADFTFEFPTNALEAKTAWRIFGPGDGDSRFWTAYGAYYDDTQKLVYSKIGLTSIHLISRITPDWIWLTYEQLDNPTAMFEFFLQQQEKAIGINITTNPNATQFNAQLQQQTQGTKFQFYQLIGWQTADTGNDGIPTLLANTNIETYFPVTSSCITCHNMANIGPPQQRRLNFWNSDDGGGIRGRIGPLDFDVIAKKQFPNLTFKQMNYVWSLREAQPKATQK